MSATATGGGTGDRSVESTGTGGVGGGVAGSGGIAGPGGRAGSPGTGECAGPMPTCLGSVMACLTDVPDPARCSNGTWTCPKFPSPTPPVDCFASPDAGPGGGTCVRGTAQVSTGCTATFNWLCPSGLIHASSCVCFVEVAGDPCGAGGRGGGGHGGAAGGGGGAGDASGPGGGTGCSVSGTGQDDTPLGFVHALAIAAFAAGRRRPRAVARTAPAA